MLFITSTFQVEQNIIKYSQFNLQSTTTFYIEHTQTKSDQSKCALVKNVEPRCERENIHKKGILEIYF